MRRPPLLFCGIAIMLVLILLCWLNVLSRNQLALSLLALYLCREAWIFGYHTYGLLRFTAGHPARDYHAQRLFHFGVEVATFCSFTLLWNLN